MLDTCRLVFDLMVLFFCLAIFFELFDKLLLHSFAYMKLSHIGY